MELYRDIKNEDSRECRINRPKAVQNVVYISDWTILQVVTLSYRGEFNILILLCFGTNVHKVRIYFVSCIIICRIKVFAEVSSEQTSVNILTSPWQIQFSFFI